MARNKKNESAIRFAPILKTLLICGFFVVSGVGYVWYKNQIGVLGRQVKERELRLAELERQNKARRDQLAVLCSPIALGERVKNLNLGLGPAGLNQMVRLVDGPVNPRIVETMKSGEATMSHAGSPPAKPPATAAHETPIRLAQHSRRN